MSRGGSLAMLAHAWSSLGRRPGKAVALGVGLALAVAVLAAVLFLADALQAEADRGLAVVPDLVVQRLVAGRPVPVERGDRDVVAGHASVERAALRVWGYVFLPALKGNVTLVGAKTPGDALSVSSAVLAEGRTFVPGAHEMIIGKRLAALLGLRPGDLFPIPSANAKASPLTVVGLFASSVELYTADVILCDEADARALLLLGPDAATDVAVWVVRPDEARVVARAALGAIPGARVIDKALLGRVHALVYGRRAGIVLAATIPALVALFVLAWDRGSGLGPDERREIAVLKAVGWSTRDVLATKLFESLLVGVAGTTTGLVLAYAWVFLLGAPGLRPALAGFSVLYPEVPLTPMVDPTELVAIVTAVLGPFVGLGIFPAWRAATMDPMEAMRG